VGIDPIYVREGATAYVVIDADEEAILQTFETRAMNAVAFQNDGGLVSTSDPVGLDNFVGEGKRTINARNAVVQNDIGLLAHGPQDLAAGKGGANGVTIGTRVRSEHEALALFDLPEYVLKHGYAFF
jgi:hypothetical protein